MITWTFERAMRVWLALTLLAGATLAAGFTMVAGPRRTLVFLLAAGFAALGGWAVKKGASRE